MYAENCKPKAGKFFSAVKIRKFTLPRLWANSENQL
jgi:hypothetical protein